MGERVKSAGHHLEARHAEGVRRIEEREAGVAFGIIAAGLHMKVLIGDDGAAVALAAGARHGDDDPQGEGVEVDDPGPGPEVLPHVPGVPGGQGDGLGAVHHRAAAHRKQQVGFCRARLLYSVPEFFRRGIGHNAAVLENFLAVAFENVNHFVVNSVFLDGTAAIDEHNVFAVTRKLLVQSVESIFPEIQFGGIAVSKVSKHIFSLLLTFFI